MTKYLARKAGCFTDPQSKAIADGEQLIDELDELSPGPLKHYQNAKYHALNPWSYEGRGSLGLILDSERGRGDLTKLGISLHYLQDTFSHAGYPDSGYGHAFGTHQVDKTNTDVPKTLRMAAATWRALKDFAKLKCNCKGNDWDDSWWDELSRFASVQTARPRRADIEGDTGFIGKLDTYASPNALRRKREILGVSPR